MSKKLKQKKGETLVETLAALLIATLSVMMLTSAITASARINNQYRKADERMAAELQVAERKSDEDMLGVDEASSKKDIQFQFSSSGIEEVEVILYGQKATADKREGEVISYKPAPQGGTP